MGGVAVRAGGLLRRPRPGPAHRHGLLAGLLRPHGRRHRADGRGRPQGDDLRRGRRRPPRRGNGGLLAAGIAVIVLASLAAAVFNLWNRVWRMGRTGQSLGKRHTGLRLIDERTGQPVGAGTCLGRELLSGLVNQVVWLSYLWMLWDDNRQTLADKAVGSTVVKLPRG
ncbi:RDD family protein [Phycicoccus endophyticus]|uniref:RDD family protein n=1 Tax=Phycicoccus endophyticus TaxID=1690220 RepID=A0A7G9R1X5_9MICO|nr:RDD family protein [Phycicoccus endophyticus]